jgi:hypothetical protein
VRLAKLGLMSGREFRNENADDASFDVSIVSGFAHCVKSQGSNPVLATTFVLTHSPSPFNRWDGLSFSGNSGGGRWMGSGNVQRYEVHLEWRRATNDHEHYVYAITTLQLLIIGSQVRALVRPPSSRPKPSKPSATGKRPFLRGYSTALFGFFRSLETLAVSQAVLAPPSLHPEIPFPAAAFRRTHTARCRTAALISWAQGRRARWSY